MSYFSIDKITSLANIEAGSKIHIIGICGTAMGQLACLLQSRGFSVSGSDKEFYDPMSSLLRARDLELFEGYSSDNIPAETAFVIIGNSVPRTNPEVLAVESRNLSYSCFPAVLSELLIAGKHSLVVSGTHGKSTTTALISFLLSELKLKPSFFFAAVAPQIENSLVVTDGKISVVEGDEYDSVFFAKVPKFSFYAPQTLIIGSIEFDHADIYETPADIEKEFDRLVRSMPAGGTVFYYGDSPVLKRMASQWLADLDLKVVSFGESDSNHHRVSSQQLGGSGQTIEILSGGNSTKFNASLIGQFNARNIAAAYLACASLGADEKQLQTAVNNFKGLQRRQQVVLDSEVTLIEDFAHHPTAIKEVIGALKKTFPGRRVWCLYEPRSNTSRREIFRNQYLGAFSQADRVVIREIESRSFEKSEQLLKVSSLVEDLNRAGIDALCFKDVREIYQHVIDQIQPGDVIVVMSNGSFDGLVQLLRAGLIKAYPADQDQKPL